EELDVRGDVQTRRSDDGVVVLQLDPDGGVQADDVAGQLAATDELHRRRGHRDGLPLHRVQVHAVVTEREVEGALAGPTDGAEADRLPPHVGGGLDGVVLDGGDAQVRPAGHRADPHDVLPVLHGGHEVDGAGATDEARAPDDRLDGGRGALDRLEGDVETLILEVPTGVGHHL